MTSSGVVILMLLCSVLTSRGDTVMDRSCSRQDCPIASLAGVGHENVKPVQQISEGQNVSITFSIEGTPNITYTPIWHIQTYKHQQGFMLQSHKTSSKREKITNTYFDKNGITAHVSNVRQNASQMDCTLTLSGLGSEWGHVVVLFSAQAQCGCKVHAPAAALVEVMSSPPHPPPIAVITPPPVTPTTTWMPSNGKTASRNSDVRGVVCLSVGTFLAGGCLGMVLGAMLGALSRRSGKRYEKMGPGSAGETATTL